MYKIIALFRSHWSTDSMLSGVYQSM